MVNINQVHVGPGGTFEPKGDFSTTPEDIDTLLDHLLGTDKESLTIHLYYGPYHAPMAPTRNV